MAKTKKKEFVLIIIITVIIFGIIAAFLFFSFFMDNDKDKRVEASEKWSTEAEDKFGSLDGIQINSETSFASDVIVDDSSDPGLSVPDTSENSAPVDEDALVKKITGHAPSTEASIPDEASEEDKNFDNSTDKTEDWVVGGDTYKALISVDGLYLRIVNFEGENTGASDTFIYSCDKFTSESKLFKISSTDLKSLIESKGTELSAEVSSFKIQGTTYRADGNNAFDLYKMKYTIDGKENYVYYILAEINPSISYLTTINSSLELTDTDLSKYYAYQIIE